MAVSSSSALRSIAHISFAEDGFHHRKDHVAKRKKENILSKNRASHILSVANHHQGGVNRRKDYSIRRNNKLSVVSCQSKNSLGFSGFELLMGCGEGNETLKLETSTNHMPRRLLHDVVCQAAPVSAPIPPLTKKVGL